jgi:hypothetical protein
MLPRTGAPIVDFDLESPFAAFHTMALMCRPDVRSREAFVAKLGVDLIDGAETDFGPFLMDVGNTITAGVPPRGALDVILDDCARDPAHRAVLDNFVAAVALLSTGRDAILSSEARFWGAAIAAAKISRLDRCAADYIWTKLIKPAGEYRALSEGPSVEVQQQEISDCVSGDPMLAGLSFYLAATLQDQHNNLSCSFENTYRIIAAYKNTLGIGLDHARRHLSRWRPVAPLWAGFLCEADCWKKDTLIDLDGLYHAFFDVMASDNRRRQVYSIAKWFIEDFLPRHRPDHASGMELRLSQIVQLPDTVRLLPPTLRPLPDHAVAAAKRIK